MENILKNLNAEDKEKVASIYDLWAKRRQIEAEHAKVKADIAVLNADLVKSDKLHLISSEAGGGRCW